jgi:RNA polymerase sigma factor (sigma-70 family)
VNEKTDAQLIRAYAESRSEAAFTEIVRRHVDLVYSAAHRMVRDSHLAEDVTQAVFVALAKNAAQLTDRPVLSGWLHRTAQNMAAQRVRTDVRRRAREQEAAMNELLAGESDAPWAQIAPHLDAALADLRESDRDALLLRYFEGKSAREMAQILRRNRGHSRAMPILNPPFSLHFGP